MRTKQDKSRISKQLHEVVYCRKLAKKIINFEGILEYSDKNEIAEYQTKSNRVAKALLKFTKGYTKSPNGRKWKK